MIKLVDLLNESRTPMNEGLGDSLKAVKVLAMKMAKKYAKEASNYIDDSVVDANLNPAKDALKVQSKIGKEVSVNEGLMDTIRKYAAGASYITGAGSLLSGLGIGGAYLNHLDSKFSEWYYSKIQKLADWEIHQLLQKKHGIDADISQWEVMALKYAFMVFFIMFVVSFAAHLITKKRR